MSTEYTSEAVQAIEGALIGDEIGRGAFRIVYDCPLDPSVVVKVAFNSIGARHNIIENKVWDEVCEVPQFRKHFAPVISISDNGRFMVMKRADMPSDRKLYPSKVPHFFTDLKYQNYGFIGKDFVCVDYASMILTNGFTLRTKNAEWWGDEQ